MNDAFDRLEGQLARAVRARRTARPTWIRRGHRRTWLAAGIAMLLASGGALAAGGVIQLGSPAEPEAASTYPLQGGGLVKGTVRLLSLASPDPAGGPAWGMRVLSTKEGEGCVQVGRLFDGKLGVVGQDYAFGDDGRFHAFALNSRFAESECTHLDGAGRMFLNATVGDIPASAWEALGGACVPVSERNTKSFGGKTRPICPQRDERDLYYGLLGPYAKSITYRLGGQSHTQPTVGPEGAYLIVTGASPTQLFNFNAGGTGGVVPVDGPITELHYRDGSTCHLTSRSWIEGKDACTPSMREPVGFTGWGEATPTRAQLRTPIHVTLVHGEGGGYGLRIGFTARVAVSNPRRTYQVRFHESATAPQIYTYMEASNPNPDSAEALGVPNIKAGQTVTWRPHRLGLRHNDTVTGWVTLRQVNGPNSQEEAEVLVGKFVLRVP